MASVLPVGAGGAGATAKLVRVRASPLQPTATDDDLPPDARIVHFIRHAEGTHNEARSATGTDEAYTSWEWLDARLTDTGEAQAAALASELSTKENRVDVVLVSPLSRAIQTGLLAFPKGDGSPPFVAVEDLRERSGTHPCDKRRSRSELRAAFPRVDFEGLATEEDAMWSEERESQADLTARAARLLGALMERPERRIGVCTHSDFLASLMRKSGLRVPRKDRATLFRNAERRAYTLRAEGAVAGNGGRAEEAGADGSGGGEEEAEK